MNHDSSTWYGVQRGRTTVWILREIPGSRQLNLLTGRIAPHPSHCSQLGEIDACQKPGVCVTNKPSSIIDLNHLTTEYYSIPCLAGKRET